MHVPTALEDAACIHAIVALSSYQLALLRLRGSPQLDSMTKENAKQSICEAGQHVMKAVHLLNKKFENPKESLSTTSLMCAAVLSACTVRHLHFSSTFCQL
jgi:hypothetical protein